MKTGFVTMSMLIGLCGGVSLFAGCADGEPGDSAFSDPGSDNALSPAGPGFPNPSRQFAGRCQLKAASSPRDLQSSSCVASNGDARAQVVGADVLGLLAISIEDTGDVHSTPGESFTLLTVTAPGLLSAGVISSSASSSDTGANAAASIAGVNASVLGIGITADVVQSTASASCGSAVGNTIITNLKIAGIHVEVSGAPNDTIEVRGILKVVLNEQVAITNGIVVRAIHITALDGTADVVLALSRAATSAACCASTPDGGPPSEPDGGILPPACDGGPLPPILDDGGLPPILEDGGLPPILGDGGLPPILGDGGLPPILDDGGLPPPYPTSDSGTPPLPPPAFDGGTPIPPPPGSDGGTPPKPGTPCNDDTDCGDRLTCVGSFL